MIIRWLAFAAAIVLFCAIGVVMIKDVIKDITRSATRKKARTNTRKKDNVIYLSKKID